MRAIPCCSGSVTPTRSRVSGAEYRGSSDGNRETICPGASWLGDAGISCVGLSVAGAESRIPTRSQLACSGGSGFTSESAFYKTRSCRRRPQALHPQLRGMPRQGRNRDRKETFRRPTPSPGSAAERRCAFLEDHKWKYQPRDAIVQQTAGASALADSALHPDPEAALGLSRGTSASSFATLAVKSTSSQRPLK